MYCQKHGYWSALWFDQCQPCYNERVSAMMDAMHLAKPFVLEREIAKANAEHLDRLNVWDSQSLAIPWFLVKENVWPYAGNVPDLTRKV